MNDLPDCVYLPPEVARAMSADAPPDLGDVLYVRIGGVVSDNALRRLDVLLRMTVSGEHQGKVREVINTTLTTIREEARRAAFKEARRKVYMISGSTNVDPAIRKGFAAGVNAAIETIAALEAAEKGERDG